MFFKQKNKEKGKYLPLAWDLGPSYARLLTLKRKGDEVYLDSFISCPLPPGLITGSLTKNNFQDSDKLQQILKALMEKSDQKVWGGQQAALAISDFSIRTFFYDLETMPSDPKDTRELLRWRAKDLLPYPAEEAVVDFQLLGTFSKDGKSFYRFFCIFLRRDILRQYEDLLHSLGFFPTQVLCSSLGVYNLFVDYLTFKEGAEHTWVLVNLEPGTTTIMVADNGIIGYFRSLREEEEEEEGALVTPSRLARELADSLHYYLSSHTKKTVNTIYLAGGRAAQPGLTAELAQALNLKVETVDLKRVARVAPHIPARDENLLPAAPGLGLAAFIK